MSMFGLLKAMVEAKVEFVLVGGLAVALHGYQRVTMDVDVVVVREEENLQRLLSMAKASGLRGPQAMATVMDILVRPAVPFADLRRDATLIGVGPISVPVALIEHLIAMKTGTGRNKDLIDIEELRKIQASE